jgi:cobalt/nickel transport system ATP-binding protein
VLNGLLPPTTGTVCYDGRVVDRAALREAAFHQRFRREVVLLFQNPDTMLFNPTVFDEIAFGPRQLGLDDVDGRVHHWAGELGLAPLLNRTPFGLSGGEKQRVCLAALLVLEPKVLLLDEPTANMDPRSTGWLVDFLADRNQTTLVTTHNLSLAGELGDRCLVLDEDHRLVYDGPVQDFLGDHDRLAAANLVHRHRHRHGRNRAQPFPRPRLGLSMNETADTIRFSVSLPGNLLEELDRRVTSRGYASRSELVRDMIRERLVEDAWQAGDEVAGVLVIIFDHHQRELAQKLIDVQHRQEVHVLCSTHVHLDHDNCLETIILQGHSARDRAYRH